MHLVTQALWLYGSCDHTHKGWVAWHVPIGHVPNWAGIKVHLDCTGLASPATLLQPDKQLPGQSRRGWSNSSDAQRCHCCRCHSLSLVFKQHSHPGHLCLGPVDDQPPILQNEVVGRPGCASLMAGLCWHAKPSQLCMSKAGRVAGLAEHWAWLLASRA